MRTDFPVVVLANILTGTQELLHACAGDRKLRIVPFTDIAEAAAHLAQARVLVVSTLQYDARIARALNEGAPLLEWIFCPNTGLETFEQHGIPRGVTLSHTPGRAAGQVAEHAMALLLGLGRGLPLLERSRAHAEWDRPRVVQALSSLAGKTLCLVGLGAIGREVARRARAFGMRITAVATHARPDADVEQVVDVAALDEALALADAVVLAVPLSAATFHLLDARRISRLKPTAIVVNVARGQVVDSAALAKALRAGRIAGAALDVFEQEPLPAASPLWALPNVILSPHVAGVGGVAEVRARALLIREQLLAFAESGVPGGHLQRQALPRPEEAQA